MKKIRRVTVFKLTKPSFNKKYYQGMDTEYRIFTNLTDKTVVEKQKELNKKQKYYFWELEKDFILNNDNKFNEFFKYFRINYLNIQNEDEILKEYSKKFFEIDLKIKDLSKEMKNKFFEQ